MILKKLGGALQLPPPSPTIPYAYVFKSLPGFTEIYYILELDKAKLSNANFWY